MFRSLNLFLGIFRKKKLSVICITDHYDPLLPTLNIAYHETKTLACSCHIKHTVKRIHSRYIVNNLIEKQSEILRSKDNINIFYSPSICSQHPSTSHIVNSQPDHKAKVITYLSANKLCEIAICLFLFAVNFLHIPSDRDLISFFLRFVKNFSTQSMKDDIP